MVHILVNEDFCKGCGLCRDACPKKIMELTADRMNKKGYHPPGVRTKASASAAAAVP